MIPFNNISLKISNNRSKLISVFMQVLDSGIFIFGKNMSLFEANFANYLRADFCIGVANGTDAIEISLRAIGVQKGDKVATVANAGMYASTAILAIGAVPFYMDVNLENGLCSFSEIENAIKNRVKAIVVTHLFGRSIQDIEKIKALCADNNVKLIEDCAQAHGVKINGKYAGTFGDCSAFSFYPTKNLGALGDAGAIVTSNKEIANKVICLRQYGWSTKYRVEHLGAKNSRLDEIQAAFLNIYLEDLDKSNMRRMNIAKRYSSEISHPKIKTIGNLGDGNVGHLYVIRTEERGSLQKYLDDLDIEWSIHYPIPDFYQPVFMEYSKFEKKDLIESFPNTILLSEEILSLPCYPELTDSQVEEIITALNNW